MREYEGRRPSGPLGPSPLPILGENIGLRWRGSGSPWTPATFLHIEERGSYVFLSPISGHLSAYFPDLWAAVEWEPAASIKFMIPCMKCFGNGRLPIREADGKPAGFQICPMCEGKTELHYNPFATRRE